MTWTYGASGSTALDKVRRRIGDTNTNDQLLSDEEIGDFLDEHDDDVPSTCVSCVEAILAKLARDIDRSNLGMSAQRSQKQQHYQDLLDRLKSKLASTATARMTGMSYDEAESLADDEDYILPAFERDRGDNHG